MAKKENTGLRTSLHELHAWVQLLLARVWQLLHAVATLGVPGLEGAAERVVRRKCIATSAFLPNGLGTLLLCSSTRSQLEYTV